MKKSEKKKVRETICDNVLWEIEGTVDHAIDYLQSLIENTNIRYSNLMLAIEYDYESTRLELTGERNETDQEYKKRMERESRQRAQDVINKQLQEERDLKEYKRLKKKYG